MTPPTATQTSPASTDAPEWAVAGRFLEALSRRDFAGLRACLDPDIRFRALTPRATLERSGPTDTVEQFQQWYGECDVLEVLDAAIGQIGTRMYLRWRVERRSAGDSGADVIEQHAFLTVGEHIEAIDLLCSGIHTAMGSAR